MKIPRKALSLLLTLCLLLATGSAAAQAPAKPSQNADGLPYVFDAFTGTPLDLAAYQGKAIFINFFTEWCGYCMREMSEIKRIFEDYSPDELQVLLVHVWDGEDAANTRSVRDTYGLHDMTFVEDEDRALAAAVGLPGYPTSIFIDKDGYLTNAVAAALTYDDMAKMVDAMGVGKAE